MLNMPDTTDLRRLSLDATGAQTDPNAIKTVAKQMEALFAYEMIKVMRETTNSSSEGTLGNDTYMSMFDMELSRLFAERDLGLQDMLVKGLTSIEEKKNQVALPQQPADRVQDQKQALRSEIKSMLPDIKHAQISSGYGMRKDPFSGEHKFHQGMDIPAPAGTDVHAIRKGKVVFSGEQRGYGNVVILDHENGFITKYAHNQKNLVKEGDEVDAGSVIAQVGSTGKSTGSHVHFEVMYKGQAVSPDTLLTERQD
jgi:murein DD-endopeptidase MepM/ murein hydrolase activator NlpD